MLRRWVILGVLVMLVSAGPTSGTTPEPTPYAGTHAHSYA